jgi:hypothetical protein
LQFPLFAIEAAVALEPERPRRPRTKLIHRHESSQAARVVAFKEWLLQQAGKTS